MDQAIGTGSPTGWGNRYLQDISWQSIKDPLERKRARNRLAQRRFRHRRKYTQLSQEQGSQSIPQRGYSSFHSPQDIRYESAETYDYNRFVNIGAATNGLSPHTRLAEDQPHYDYLYNQDQYTQDSFTQDQSLIDYSIPGHSPVNQPHSAVYRPDFLYGNSAKEAELFNSRTQYYSTSPTETLPYYNCLYFGNKDPCGVISNLDTPNFNPHNSIVPDKLWIELGSKATSPIELLQGYNSSQPKTDRSTTLSPIPNFTGFGIDLNEDSSTFTNH